VAGVAWWYDVCVWQSRVAMCVFLWLALSVAAIIVKYQYDIIMAGNIHVAK